MLSLILNILSTILNLAGLVLFIIVLIKLFKTKGALHGILGILSCSLYPFIWGWVKNKQLQITKIMIAWTSCEVVSIIIIVIAFQLGLSEVMKIGEQFQQQATQPQVMQRKIQKTPPKPKPKPAIKTAPAVKKNKAADLAKKAAKEEADFKFEMKRIENLLKLNSKNSDALFNRGKLNEVKGDLNKAEQDYTEAIDINKRDADALYNRGLLYVKSKNYEQALKDFSAVIKIQPRSVDAYCNRGNVHFQLGKIDLALTDYSVALKRNPNDAEIYLNRGIVYLAKGDKIKAKEDFAKASKLGNSKAKKLLQDISLEQVKQSKKG